MMNLRRKMRTGSQFCSTCRKYILVRWSLTLVLFFSLFGIDLNLPLPTNYDCQIDEWTNFQDRIKDPKNEFSDKDKSELIRQWVSYRGQTLSRTGLDNE